ncbi:putative anti-sigma regulatory factor, serine/threonine protein kinase [Catenulispora acidiphila DSM 44928]|uniref:Putative anti-sigma regulatory factor, serine/threonine protein kinase n=1 Tax=Catenulispora acidiphila (strain DSM 44928 / JCM 14897 / NBRC 102108 / NRRL B-24433 / ID139908) TaxID=479433 RepID=C7QEE8_CATAD|nr:ATP-binding protein [Catenulispora acidiphila]ACU70839.1 putative anti-sigma regulatory factor, serine/threonine protein kinase [Catenulispora acidiphila DSM 44928]
MTSRRTAHTQLAPGPSAPAAARAFLTETCTRWHAEDFVTDAALVVSELITNAVRHAGTEMRLELELDDGMLTVRVHDRSPGLPRLIPPSERVFGGQGLAIVVQLAQAWGVAVEDGGGKAVWCRLGPRAAVPAGAGTQASPWKGEQDVWSA